MPAACRVKIRDHTQKVRATDEKADSAARIGRERQSGGDQCKPAGKPDQRARMHERLDQPSDAGRKCWPNRQRHHRPDEKPLHQHAMHHGDARADHSGCDESCILPDHPYTSEWKSNLDAGIRQYTRVWCDMDAATSTDRLTRQDWIRHGLRTLARSGAQALKVGALAQGLDVSRGSFYWHFRDIADYRQQLLENWRERATEGVIRDIDDSIVGAARLIYLMKLLFGKTAHWIARSGGGPPSTAAWQRSSRLSTPAASPIWRPCCRGGR